MKIEFTVQDIPPKKDGANSMWLKNSEAPRILSLRKAALDAMKKAGLKACILSPVKLEVTVLAPSSQFIRNSGNYIGDLDTLVAGICDGLQAAHSNTPIAHALFQNLQTPEIHPNHKLLLNDDAQVMTIVAKKERLDNSQQTYYQIVLEAI
jgi:hypothetical protein